MAKMKSTTPYGVSKSSTAKSQSATKSSKVKSTNPYGTTKDEDDVTVASPVTTSGTVNSDGFITVSTKSHKAHEGQRNPFTDPADTTTIKTKAAESERGKMLEERGRQIETPELDKVKTENTEATTFKEKVKAAFSKPTETLKTAKSQQLDNMSDYGKGAIASFIKSEDEIDTSEKSEAYKKGVNLWQDIRDNLGRPIARAESAVGGYVGSMESAAGTAIESLGGGKETDVLNPIAKKLREDADYNIKVSEEDAARGAEGYGKVGQFINQAEIAGMQTVLDYILSEATGIPGKLVMAIRVFGSSVNESANKGYDLNTQLGIGLGNASIAYMTEKMFGGNPVYDKTGSIAGLEDAGAVTKLVQKVGQKLGMNNAVLSFLSSRPVESINEAFEEITEDVLDPIVELIYTGKADWPTIEEMLSDGAVGAILGVGGQYVNAKVNGEAIESNVVSNAVEAIKNKANAKANATQTTQKGNAFSSAYNEFLANKNAQDTTQTVSPTAEQNVEQTNPLTNALDQVKQNASQTVQQAQPSTNIPNVETAPTNDSGVSNNTSNAISEEAQELVDDFLALQEKAKTTTNQDELNDIQENMYNDRVLLNDMGIDVDNLNVSTWNGESQQTTNQSFQEIQEDATEFHPINVEAQAQAQALHGRGPVQIPTTDANGNATSKTGSTLANSPITTNEGAVELQDEYAKGSFSYIPITDANASAKAEQTIRNNGWDYALASYKQAVTDGKSSKDITALGVTLYNNALNAGDTKQAIDIATLMVKNARTTAQALQANGMINKLTPEGKLYALAKSVDTITSELQAKHGDGFQLVLDEDLVAYYKYCLENGDEAMAREAYNEIMKDIGRQLPKNAGDVITSIRYLSMLGNFKTQIRNVAGNAGFTAVRSIKNIVQIGLENAIIGKKGQGSGRTTAMLNRVTDAALITECKNDYDNVSGQIMSGGKYQDTDTYDAIREGKQSVAFKNKAIEKSAAEGNVLAKVVNGALTGVQAYSDATNWAMDKGDVIFSQPTYACALARYCKANGYTSFSQMSEAEQAKARAVAVQEAAKATYRDSNVLSDLVTDASRAVKTKAKYGGKNGKGQALYKGIDLLAEGVIPFKKTPANILMRAYEYSPVNAVVSGIQTAKASSEVSKATTAEAQQTAKANLASSIEGLASGLTGSALIAMGALLARFGLINGGESDDEKQAAFDELQGKQAYSFNFPNGINITADWLAPECIPLFIGANLYQASLDEGLTFQETIQSMRGITEPLVEMSMLDGLEDFLNTGKYVQDAKITDYIVSAATNFVGQFTPTLFGQLERGFEDRREETYRYNDEASDTLSSSQQRSLGQLLNKVPGVDYQQIDYVDEWGRTQDYQSTAGNLLYQALSPGYASQEKEIANVETLLQYLYDSGYTDVLPTKREQSTQFSFRDENGEIVETRHLTADEYEQYLKTAGTKKLYMLTKLTNDNDFNYLPFETQAEIISDVYELANDYANLEVDENAKVSQWAKNAMNASDPVKYLLTLKALESDSLSEAQTDAVIKNVYSDLSASDKETINSDYSLADEMYEASQAGYSPSAYKTTKENLSWSSDKEYSSEDYTKIDEAVAEYQSMPEAVQDLFTGTDYLKSLSNASTLGVDAETYFTTYSAIEDLDNSGGTSNYEKMQAVLETTDARNQDAVMMSILYSDNSLASQKYQTARSHGWSAAKYVKASGAIDGLSKKAEKIAALEAAGFSSADALYFYKLSAATSTTLYKYQ